MKMATKLNKFVGEVFLADADNPSELTNLGCVLDVSVTYNNTANEVIIESDNCGEIDRIKESEGSIQATALDIVDRDLVLKVLGGIAFDVVNAPVVGATQNIKSFDFTNFFVLDGQNGDGTAPTVTTVTGSVDGVLTAVTDYNLVQKTFNKVTLWGLEFVAGGAIADLTQEMDVVYTYTPAASAGVTLDIGQVSTKYLKVVVVAVRDDGSRYSYTLDRASIASEYVTEFISIVRSGSQPTGATLQFIGAKGSVLRFDDQAQV